MPSATGVIPVDVSERASAELCTSTTHVTRAVGSYRLLQCQLDRLSGLIDRMLSSRCFFIWCNLVLEESTVRGVLGS